MIRPLFSLREVPAGRWLAAALALLLASGCASAREGLAAKVQQRPYFRPTNFHAEPQLPADVRRVLLLPVCGGTIATPESAAALEEVFATELQKQLRFEVVRLTREECQRRFGAPEFSSTAMLPHDFLATVGREFGAEAVLFVDVTSFRAYPPLALGVRAKLATIASTRLLWTFDEIFAADDAAVANSVQLFYASSAPAGVPVNAGQGALQSPGKFAAYVAAATFNTLPPR